MKWNASKGLMLPCLMALGVSLSGCGAASVIEIPASLKAPCESTVDVSGAQTVGDLGRAIVQGDGDLRVCAARKDAVVAIAESGKRSWFSRLRPG